MVRNYKRKTDRGIWKEDDMRRAVRAVLNETMGFLRASATYNVPKSTLERRVRKARCAEDADTDSDNDYGKKKLGRYKTVFNKEQEEECVLIMPHGVSHFAPIMGQDGIFDMCHLVPICQKNM